MTAEQKPAMKFSLSELAGAFGDFGTIIPLILAVALVTTMNVGYMLLFFGIWFIVTGWYYGLPIPIEPMKAIAVVVIAEQLSAGEVAAAELIKMDLDDLVIERMVVDLLANAVNIREVRIINCHKRGNIEKAINGKNVGTIIRAE